MPRAFLIKSKKERKKVEEGDEERRHSQEQLQCIRESPETSLASTDDLSRISQPQATSEQHTEVEDVVKIQAEETAETVSEQSLPSPIPRGKTKAKKALKEVQICEPPQSKKARKRAPKRSPIYYYSDENDGPRSESERNSRCLGQPRVSSSIPNTLNYHTPSSAVKCNDTEREAYCSPRQNEQSRGQENSRQFEFQTSTAHELPREENKPRFAQITDDKENQINEGLDNVKILEYHSISSNMEVVYPDVPKPLESRATESRAAEKFYPLQSSPAVPVSQAPQSAEVSQNAAAVATQAPVATQPVIHYVPVFAVQGPNGVYYEPVPGAPHVVQNGPPAPYPTPQAGHPQAVQRVPEQAVPRQPPPQQFGSHQAMPPAQAQQVTPQQVPQPQPMQPPSAVVHHQQLPPQQPGTPPYPVPQPYNPPTYPQQPQAMTYSAESPSYAKPVQVGPGMPYPPSSPVAMATKPYPVPAQAQVPMPQHYVAQPQSGHAVMQYPQYPPSSQPAAVPQGYQTQGHPPASQGQVLQQYPHMPNQPQPHLPVQPGVAPQPYPVQQPPQQPNMAYQPPQTSAPYPHSTPVVVAQQPYPANKTSPVPTAPYSAASRPAMQYAQPTNPPNTSQTQYYPPKTVASQPHPATAAPAVAYPENRGMAPAHYMPREGEPKFVYAPPPVNFHQSPVYRVPEQGKGAEPAAMPMLSPNPSHDKAVSGSKRRKATVPHRGMRDIPSPPDSCGEQASPRVGSEKGNCHSPLNKSSCIITPPGSPQDKEQGDNGETYTVVVHDRGIQTRPPEMEPRWCPTKRLWKMEPKRFPHPVQQQQPLVESVKGVKVEVPLSDDESLSPPQFSPTQKENMYIPDENSMNTQRPHGMRRGKGRKSSSRYHCKFCSKGFQWHSHLTSHERTHTGEKPYQCSECSRAFTRADGLQCHMIVHNKKKPFKCQYCAKGFSDNTLLEKHVYSHTGVKPFKCEYCGRAFTDSHSIEKHLLVHTGTKPFKCQYCVRSFNDSQMLVRHIRSHTGEKPYKCHHCPMAFSKQSALVIHTRVHTGEKPYKCPNCPKSFSISGNLQRHILIHTGERPYKCSKCPKAFNNPSHLSRHISKLHAPKVLEKNCVAVPIEADTVQVEMAQ